MMTTTLSKDSPIDSENKAKAEPTLGENPQHKAPENNAVFLHELTNLLGSRWIITDPCLLDTYAWQMNAETIVDGRFLPRYMAVVLPKDTAEVAAIVRLCNKFSIQFKATATGQGPWNAPALEDKAVQIDLRRMDQILQIDAKNMYCVIEPYVTNNQLQTECHKLGFNSHVVGAGGQASQLASATSFNGHGPDGISCGFSSRNLLGFEWVTPEGEIVQAGSFASSGSYFMGDGPGPSLRGVIRGFAGAMGGLGVFTKAALKIYPWYGPKKLNVQGYSPSYYTEIPDHHIAGFFSLPANDIKTKADFGYALGEADIASHVLINAPAMSIAALYPDNNKAVKGYRIPIMNKMHNNIYLITTALHQKEYLYKKKVIHHLVREFDAGFLGADTGLTGLENKSRWFLRFIRDLGIGDFIKSISGLSGYAINEFRIHGFNKMLNGNPMDNALYGKLMRADANLRVVTSFGGSFVTSMGCLVPWDVSVRSAQVTLAIRQRLLAEKKLVVKDDGDGDHGGLYEGGAYSHIESAVFYAPTNQVEGEIMREYNVEANLAAIEHNLGVPITSCGPAGAHMFSAHALHYDRFTSRIKQFYDPLNSSETSWYTQASYKPNERDAELQKTVETNRHVVNKAHLDSSDKLMGFDQHSGWITKRGYNDLVI